jgi:hypothetical protein
MLLWWVSTGEAAEGQEKVDGARIGVAYTWVVHGHTAWNIIDEIPFLWVNDVPLLCLGLPNYGYKLSSVLMENCAVGQLGRTLWVAAMCCAAEGGSVKGSVPWTSSLMLFRSEKMQGQFVPRSPGVESGDLKVAVQVAWIGRERSRRVGGGLHTWMQEVLRGN